MGRMRQAVRAVIVKDDELLVMHRNKFGNEYYTLVGGGVEIGEDLEAALRRELLEETGLQISDPRLVYIEEAGEPYGSQYVYQCRYVGGDIVLHPDSEEAQINKLGKNLYTPQWLPVSRLADVPFVSPGLKRRLLEALASGQWPDPAERFSPAA